MAVDFIPEKFYIARQPRGMSDEWLGFMQPMHQDGFKSRKETADNWAGKTSLAPIEWQNVPTKGFSLTENKRRYMNKNVVWRVLHPLGFEFEITSDNFSDFLMEIDMHQGVIQTEMVFVRRQGENYLTYVDSPEYKKAITQDKMEAKVSVKDVQPGDAVTIKSGEQRIYRGALHRLDLHIDTHPHRDRDNKPALDMNTKSKRRHYFEHIVGGKPSGRYEEVSTLNIRSLDVQQMDPSTPEQLLEIFRNKLLDPDVGHCGVFDLKPFTLAQCKVTLVEIPFNNSNVQSKAIQASTYDCAHYLVKYKDDGQLYIYNGYQSYYGNQTASHYLYKTDVHDINDTQLRTYTLTHGGGYRGRWEQTRHNAKINIADIESAYVQVVERV